MIQETSLEAYYDIIGELGCRQTEILNTIKRYGALSNIDLSRILALPINSITPRVKELRDKGLVVYSHKKQDRITKRNVMVWKVKE